MSYFEICPNCDSDDILFNRKKNFFRCEGCGFTYGSSQKPPKNFSEMPRLIKAEIDLLPFPLALSFYEYAREENPYLRLYRLTDAAEMLTRFLTVVALSDILRRQGDFPDKLKEELTRKIELPTFGGWKELLRVSVSSLEEGKRTDNWFVVGLPDFVNKILLPLLGANDDNPREQIIALRNLLAHQGRLGDKQAAELLDQHQARFERLFHELNFLNNYDLIACKSEASSVYLRGLPRDDGSFPDYTDPIGSVRLKSGSVYLLHRGQALNLFPLQIFGAVLRWRDDLTEPEKIVEAAPQIYFRFGRKGQLDFTPLTDEAFFSHQRGAALESFNQIFSLEEWRKTIAERKGIQTSAFDDLLRELLAVFVGREKDINTVKEKLKGFNGVLWISGQPGVGKSALMAKLINDYQNSRHHFVFPYLFRLGHTGATVDSFLKAALVRLYQTLGLPMNLGAHIEERRTLFINLVREASQTLKQKIWFLIDGVDEIYRLDKSFLSLPLAASGESVVWLCAGRSEPPEIEEILRRQGAVWVFPEGLGVLNEQGVRTMLLEHLDRLRFPLLKRDKQKSRQTVGKTASTAVESYQSDLEWSNEFIDTLARRSEGLPLYVRMTIDDLQTGKLTVSDEKNLPEGLSAYFERILERLRVSDVGTVLTPLFCLLVWAKEPVTEAALLELMSGHHLSKNPRWQTSFQKALSHGHLMLRHELTPGGEYGWTFYHDSFRRYLQNSTQIQDNRGWACEQWLKKCSQWQSITEKSLRAYALRNAATHLHEAKKWRHLFELARDTSFHHIQKQDFPSNPELTLQLLQLALQGALEVDDAAGIAEFMIKHSRQVNELRRESPLQALRRSSLERAMKLADLHEAQNRVLIYLLLIWELRETNRIEEGYTVLEKLQKAQQMQFDDQEIIALLLSRLLDVNKELFDYLQIKLLNNDGLNKLAKQLSGIGNDKVSYEIAQTISEEQIRADALICIASELAQRNESDRSEFIYNQAILAIQKVDNERERTKLFCEFVVSTVKANFFDISLLALKDIKDKKEKDYALSYLLSGLCSVAFFNQSLLSKYALVWGSDKVEALSEISVSLFNSGHQQYANLVLEQALEIARGIKISEKFSDYDSENRIKGLIPVAAALSQFGEREKAQSIYDEILSLSENLGSESKKAKALSKIAAALSLAGFQDKARSTLDVAVLLKSSEVSKAEVFSSFASALALAGQHEQAESMFEQVLAVAKENKNYFFISLFLLQITTDLARAGYTTRALSTAQLISSDSVKANALCEIATAFAKKGDADNAKNFYQRAFRSAESDKYVNFKITALCKIGVDSARFGDQELADKAFAQSIIMTDEIKKEYEKKEILENIATASTLAGNPYQAIRAALKFNDEFDDTSVIKNIAFAFAYTIKFDQALPITQTTIIFIKEGETVQKIAVILEIIGQRAHSELFLEKIVNNVSYSIQEKSAVLCAVASALAQTDERTKAELLIKRAVTKAKEIHVKYEESEDISKIAVQAAKAGLFESSLAIAEEIREEDEQRNILRKISIELARGGRNEQARFLLDQILTKTPENKNEILFFKLQFFVVSLTKAGFFEEAYSLMESIDARAFNSLDGAYRDNLFLNQLHIEMAAGLIRAGRYDQINLVLVRKQMVKYLYHAVWPLITKQNLSQLFYWTKSKFKKEISLEKSQSSSNLVSSDKNRRSDISPRFTIIIPEHCEQQYFKEVVPAFAESGYFDEARQTMQLLKDQPDKVMVLTETASVLSAEERSAESESLFDQALEIADNINEKWSKPSALRRVASSLAKAHFFDKALNVAREIMDEEERLDALADVAVSFAQIGRFDEALAIARSSFSKDEETKGEDNFQNALKSYNKHRFEQIKRNKQAAVLSEIASSYKIAGQDEQSFSLFNEALETATNIDSEKEGSGALSKIAVSLAQAGLFDQALGVVSKIIVKHDKSFALREIAGQAAEADCFEKSLEVSQLIVEETNLVDALHRIAAVQVTNHKTESFKKLLPVISYIPEAPFDFLDLLVQVYPENIESLMQLVHRELISVTDNNAVS